MVGSVLHDLILVSGLWLLLVSYQQWQVVRVATNQRESDSPYGTTTRMKISSDDFSRLSRLMND